MDAMSARGPDLYRILGARARKNISSQRARRKNKVVGYWFLVFGESFNAVFPRPFEKRLPVFVAAG
jgi:hypothetical protein